MPNKLTPQQSRQLAIIAGSPLGNIYTMVDADYLGEYMENYPNVEPWFESACAISREIVVNDDRDLMIEDPQTLLELLKARLSSEDWSRIDEHLSTSPDAWTLE
jgi:hypothetical protein